MKIPIQLPGLKQLRLQVHRLEDDTWILSPSQTQGAGPTGEAGTVCYLWLEASFTLNPSPPHTHLNTHMGLSKSPWVGSGKPPPESVMTAEGGLKFTGHCVGRFSGTVSCVSLPLCNYY